MVDPEACVLCAAVLHTMPPEASLVGVLRGSGGLQDKYENNAKDSGGVTEGNAS